MEVASTAQFVGRESEFNSAARIIGQAKAGSGGIVVVEGEPGIGKTALIDEVSRVAAARGLTVLRGAAKELEQRVPFAAIGWCLRAEGLPPDPLLERVRSFLRGEGISSSGAINHEYAVRETILSLLDRWCTDGPVAVILDDAQWADPSSLSVVRQLGEIAGELPLFMMIATRPLPRGEGLSGLLMQLDSGDATRLPLGPMGEDAVALMVKRAVGSPPGPGLAAVVASAGGNPLYITELIACLRDEGAIAVVDGVARDVGIRTDGGPWRYRLPTSLTDAVLRRLDFLSAPARQVLPMAAALGPGIEVTELSMVLGSSVLDVWNAVSAAVDAGILVNAGAELLFRHDLIRQVFADQVPESTRINLQRRAAHVLISEGAPVERTAHYVSIGEGPIDSRGLQWLVGAADTLIVRAPQLAVLLLGRALAATDLDDTAYSVLLLQQIRALLWSGRPAEAEAAVRAGLAAVQSADAPNPATENVLYWLLKAACFAQGHLHDTVTEGETALRRPGLTDQERGQFHGFNALAYVFLEEFEAAERAATIAISTEDAVATQSGCFALGILRYTQGYLDEGLELGDRVVAVYETGMRGERSDQFDPYVLRAHCLIELDRLTEAEQTLTTAVRHNQQVRHNQPVRHDRLVQHNQLNPAAYLAPNLAAQARLHFLDGRWDDGLAEIRACLETPDMFGYGLMTHSLAALIAVHRATFTADPDTLPSLDDRFGARSYLQFRPWVQALVDEAHGRPRQALESLLDTCRGVGVASGLTASTLYYVYPDLARLAAVTGDADRAREVAAAAEAFATRQSTPSRRGTALLCRGLADARPEFIADAAEAFRLAGRPLYEGKAYETLAATLARQDRPGEAHSALDAAVQLYAGLDAEWDIARAEAWLREYGVRRGRRGPRKRPKTGWAALTATEQKVAKLVAQGHTNSDIAGQLFLSRRTVQSHVSSILAKLELRSRVQVAVSVTSLSDQFNR